MIEFGDADVVRHPLVAALIRAYDARDRAKSMASELRRPRDENTDHEDTRGGAPDAPEAR